MKARHRGRGLCYVQPAARFRRIAGPLGNGQEHSRAVSYSPCPASTPCLLEKEPISTLADELGLQATLFYRWRWAKQA